MAVATPDAPTASAADALKNIGAKEMKQGLRAAAGVKAERAGDRLSPRERAVVEKGREQFAAGNVAESLTTLAGDKKADRLQGDWRKVTADKIASNINPDGTRTPTPAEAAEIQRVTKLAETYDEYLDKGYDGIEDDPPGTPNALTAAEKQTRLCDQIDELIRNNPTLNEAYGDPPSASPPATRSLLRQPGMREALARVINKEVDPTSLSAETAKELADARKGLTEKERARVEAQTRRDGIANAPAERTAFNSDPSYTATSVAGRGAESKLSATQYLQGELAAAGGALGTPEFGVSHFKDNLDNLATANKVLEANPTDAAAIQTVAELNRYIADAKNDPTYGARCAEFQTLYTESQGIDARLAQQGELPNLDQKLADAMREEAEAKGKVDAAEAQVKAASADFVKNMDNAVGDATQEYLVDAVGKFWGAYKTAETGAGPDAVKKNEDMVREYMNTRYKERYTSRFSRQEKWRLNKGQAEGDFATLIGAGPNAVIEQVLIDAGVSDVDRALMLGDKDFMDQKRSEITGEVLSAFVLTGHKLDEQQIKGLMLTDYGNGAMDVMLQNNKDAQEKIAEMKKSGVLYEGTVTEMRKKFGTTGLLALLLGTTIGLGWAALKTVDNAGA